jgi:processive 1,2-diacylglycerol beta-glucosyltransferase
MAACDVLKDILPDCELKLIRPIHEFFQSMFNEEEWYGSFLKNGWIKTGNFIARYPGPMIFKFRRKTFERRLVRLLEQEKPDLLISVIPLINSPASFAAKRCKIPFMVITLDADLELWLADMERSRTLDFTITVQTKTPRIEKQIQQKHLSLDCVREVGSPLRKDFFTPKNCPAIRKEWGIPDNKEVIMLLRGSTGSNKMVDYVKSLVTLDRNVHLLVCVGRNTALTRKLSRIKNNGPVTFTVVPFTPKIPDLMAVSNLLITQPSPNVCNEAMYMNLPILVDMTTTCVFWEKATLDWIHLQGSGDTFKRMSQMNKIVIANLDKHKNAQNTAPTKQMHSFNAEIRKIVCEKISNLT